jgi:hypothetical protein
MISGEQDPTLAKKIILHVVRRTKQGFVSFSSHISVDSPAAQIILAKR